MVSEWPGSSCAPALEFSVARGAQEMDHRVAIDMDKCQRTTFGQLVFSISYSFSYILSTQTDAEFLRLTSKSPSLKIWGKYYNPSQQMKPQWSFQWATWNIWIVTCFQIIYTTPRGYFPTLCKWLCCLCFSSPLLPCPITLTIPFSCSNAQPFFKLIPSL